MLRQLVSRTRLTRCVILCPLTKTSLIPFSSGSLSLERVRQALRPLKLALDERDFWNSAAHEHEAQEMAKRKTRNSRRVRGRGVDLDRYPTTQGHAGIQAKDLSLTRRSFRNVPSKVPRNIAAQIVFDVVRVLSAITTSTGGLVETNFSFTLNTHPEQAQWSALFDQWCIPQVAVTFTNTEAPGATGSLPTLTTAVDFDNTTNLGSATLLLEFENSQSVTLAPGASHTRACHPCVKTMLASSGSSSGVDRMWCDSSNPGGTWFGIRSIAVPAVTATNTISVTQTIWYAFRSGI